MKGKKTFTKYIAVMMSIVLTLGTIPVTAFAEDGTGVIGGFTEYTGGDMAAFGEVIEFAALAEDIAEQKLPYASELTAVNLPETLTATVGDGLPETEPSEITTPAPLTVTELTYGRTETELDIPVEWSCPEFNGEQPGTYTFTAAVTDGGFSVTDEPPVIKVTVGEAVTEAGKNKVGGVNITIQENETGNTSLYLPVGEPITNNDLLAGVSAKDENGEAATITVADADGLDYDDPQPKRGRPVDPQPYIITYAAGSSTAMRECYVTKVDKTGTTLITGFQPLEPEVVSIEIPLPVNGAAAITLKDIPFPEALTAYDGEEADSGRNTYQIPVDKWICASCEADCDFTALGSHTFQPEFTDSEYAIDEGARTPQITVNIVVGVVKRSMALAITRTANTFLDLENAIAAFNKGNEDMEITIGASFNITKPLIVSNANNKKLTIKSSGTGAYTLTRGVSGNLFTVGQSTERTELDLINITIDGNKSSYSSKKADSSLICVDGRSTLRVRNGATLKNNCAQFGGGVYVKSGNFYLTAGGGR